MGKIEILSFTWYFLHKILPFFPFVTSAIANLSTGSKKKMFSISYAVVRPKMPSTFLKFVGLKSYTVQIRVVHCIKIIYIVSQLDRPRKQLLQYYFTFQIFLCCHYTFLLDFCFIFLHNTKLQTFISIDVYHFFKEVLNIMF